MKQIYSTCFAFDRFCDRILSICELSQPASRQLAHDIGYLNNVLQDLGISLSENLQQLATLLKLLNDQCHSGTSTQRR
ncbi:hypothetical protein Zmor_002478 [Zophobas morio]|uniref:Conserved oligomeric Golgi complex subunit 7 n=1 Tax=Zophobas morio TaxID=2755281 RepID=A0AA38MTU9_9CUCU|nr:hypothetical protein Zmor_002478 [Zophobas morio]